MRQTWQTPIIAQLALMIPNTLLHPAHCPTPVRYFLLLDDEKHFQNPNIAKWPMRVYIGKVNSKNSVYIPVLQSVFISGI